MSPFDANEQALRLRALARERDIPLWAALLDAADSTQLYRIFESTVLSNGWETALHAIDPKWRGLGTEVLSQLNRAETAVLKISESEQRYAAAFFNIASTVWMSFRDDVPAAQRRAIRSALQREQALRIRQAATEKLPLGLPSQALATRLPCVPIFGRDSREHTTLLLAPADPPHTSAPLLEVLLRVDSVGLLLHVTPCDHSGVALRRPHAAADSPGRTLTSATWEDLGLGVTGPYVLIRHAGDDWVTPTLAESFDVRFVSGTDRAALLLCTQFDSVRVEFIDQGCGLACKVSCTSAGVLTHAQLRYDDAALCGPPSRPRTHSPSS